MKKTITIHVNDSLQAMGERFADAWHRAEAGREMAETHIGFVELEAMLSDLTPKRMELLRALHAHPAKDVMALSKALGRDYKRVHQDVRELSATGLVVKGPRGVCVPYDVVHAEMKL